MTALGVVVLMLSMPRLVRVILLNVVLPMATGYLLVNLLGSLFK